MTTRSIAVRLALYEEIMTAVAEALSLGLEPDFSDYSSSDVYHTFRYGFQGPLQCDVNVLWLDDLIDKINDCGGAFKLTHLGKNAFSKSVRGAAWYGQLVSETISRRIIITPTASPITYDS